LDYNYDELDGIIKEVVAKNELLSQAEDAEATYESDKNLGSSYYI
jgi:hypothetical protein